MDCKNCGRQNPSASLYCQDCGHRLGDWVPPERPAKAPTPPTGMNRANEGPAAMNNCPRCGSTNAPHMRFCNNCGFQLGAPAAAPFAQPAPAHGAPAHQSPGHYSPPQPQQPPSAYSPAPQASPAYGVPHAGLVCWRCRAAGDAGAEFCKFCGARYVDDPARGGRPVPQVAHSPMAGVPSPVSVAPAPSASPSSRGPSTVAVAGPAAGAAVRAVLVAILKDGSDGKTYPLVDEMTDLGRLEGQIILGDDPYLSPRHARVFAPVGEPLVIRDLDSLNGVYVRVREPVELSDNDTVLLGQQVLRFEVLPEAEISLGPAMHRGALVFGTPEVPRIARLVQYTTEGVGRDLHYLYRDETVIGREQGDIVCTDDPFMSRRHASITVDRAARRFVLRDLGSSNGTAIRVRGERAIRPGDQFRVGRHLFRYDRPGETGGGRAGA